MYRTIFFFTNSCEPELAHRLQTSKMRRNSNSLNSCQHDDINIVTVSVARRRWTAPLKPRRPCAKHFTTFYALFVFSNCMATCLIHIPHLFPLSFAVPSLSPVTSFFTARITPHENVTAAILSYAVSHLHEGIGKLRKTCADTVGHLTEPVPSLTVSEKWPPAQRFDAQAVDRRSPIQVLTQRKAAWLGWSPGTGHLPHTEHCRYDILRYIKTRFTQGRLFYTQRAFFLRPRAIILRTGARRGPFCCL